MRNLCINKKQLIALNYLGKVAQKDSKGFETGESIVEYSEEIPFKAHLSGARGSTTTDVFGSEFHYDKTFNLTLWELKRLGFTENTVFFIDKKPEYDENNQPLYDYKVERIADTINEVVIAISKVQQNGKR